MNLLKRIAAIALATIGLLGTAGVMSDKSSLSLLLVFGAMFVGAALLWRSAGHDGGRSAVLAEQQKLLALAAREGTLTPAMLQAGLTMTKDEAVAALTRLRESGLAEFDVDEAGAPVYRVQKAALEARKAKGW